jgi:hypothetical protein
MHEGLTQGWLIHVHSYVAKNEAPQIYREYTYFENQYGSGDRGTTGYILSSNGAAPYTKTPLTSENFGKPDLLSICVDLSFEQRPPKPSLPGEPYPHLIPTVPVWERPHEQGQYNI